MATSALAAMQADPNKSAVIDKIHELVHLIATSDPVADRAMIDKWLGILGWIAFFIPGGATVVAAIKAIVDAPGGVEAIIEIAKEIDAFLPPLPA